MNINNLLCDCSAVAGYCARVNYKDDGFGIRDMLFEVTAQARVARYIN